MTMQEIDKITMKTRLNIRNCFRLDLTSFGNIRQIMMTFKKCDNCGVKAIIEDMSMMSERELGLFNFYTSGEALENRWLGVNTEQGRGLRTYVVKFDQEIFVEKDKSKHCVVYPNKMYNNYNDCDKDFVGGSLEKHFGKEFIPIWATNDLGKVSSGNVVNPLEMFNFAELFDGSKASSCPLPCRTTHVTSKLLNVKYSNEPSLHIMFADSVTVTKTDFVSFSLWTFLADTGGAMGLWLGLGVIQATELLFTGAALLVRMANDGRRRENHVQ